jgi:hypothetical protein
MIFIIGHRSTGASILRLIFLIVSYPVGRLNFAYKPPPDDQTPLVLKIFNPTFWALAELWLGVWAANLPPCSPLLRGLHFHPYRMLSNVYRRTWTRKSSTASPSSSPSEREGKGSNAGLSSRDSAPLVPADRSHSHGHGRNFSVASEKPPSLRPMEWTGTGRLSVFGRLPSAESVSR